MTHTPGPWEFDVVGREGNPNDPWHCAIVGPAIGRHVVIVDTLNCSCVFSPDDQRANARLIAAAPEMLEACASVWAHLADTDDPDLRQIANECRAAIAKAEGQS